MRELVQVPPFPGKQKLQKYQLEKELLLPVINECRLGAKAPATVGAEKVSFSGMDNIVNPQLLCKCKLFSTQITLKRFLS